MLVCPHRPPCPGCPRLGELGPSAAVLAALTPLIERTGVAIEAVETGQPTHFRTRARLAVRGRARSPKVGIFQEGTHRVVDIPRCAIHHPLINDVARAVKVAIQRTGVRPYSDEAHAGELRYVQVVVQREPETAQVVLVMNNDAPGEPAPLFKEITALLGDRLQGLFWNGHAERTNTILGPRFEKVAGADAVRETIGGVAVFFPPGAFGQSHFALAERMACFVRDEVPDGARVAEFYAGTGAIGLGLLDRVESVAFNEVSPHGLAGLSLGLESQSQSARAKATVHPGTAGDATPLLDRASIVIVDPPRRGLDAPLLSALAARRSAPILYVACGLAAFLRDATALLDAGYRLSKLRAYDLFAYTEHLELVARFDVRT